MTKALTQKRHVNLSDYEMTTTLGTGKLGLVLLLQLSAAKKSLEYLVNNKICRFVWKSAFG